MYAWDTREFSSNVQWAANSSAPCVRPDYRTEHAPDYQNTCSIVAMSSVERDLRAADEHSSLSMKWKDLQGDSILELVCLSEWSHITVWLVKEVTRADAATLEQSDLGLRIGGMPNSDSIASTSIAGCPYG